MLLKDTQVDMVMADKACDAHNRVIGLLLQAGKTVVIPPNASRRHQRGYDSHLIENFFARLKQYRAIATRYYKTARNFLSAIHLAAALVWLN